MKYSYLSFLLNIYINTEKIIIRGGTTLVYDVLIFFIFMIILLGMIGSFFLLLKNALNEDDALLIDPKPPLPLEKEK